MVETSTWLLIGAVAALGLVAVSAALNPLMARLAFRNTLRRPKQSAMIVAGLMVGTAIVAGAQVTGDSLDYSIRKATYDSFGEIDETVFMEGFNFFPEFVADELAAHPRLAATAEAVSPQAIWDTSASNPRTGLHEPEVRLIGFDAARDRAFGPFEHQGDRYYAEDLAPDETILVDTLAQALDAEVGDTLVLNYSVPVDPVVPHLANFTGEVTSTSGDLPVRAPQDQPFLHNFTVDVNAVHLALVVGWTPSTGEDLDATLIGPTGQTWQDLDGTTGSPDVPIVINVTGSIADPLENGTWQLQLFAEAGANVPFNGSIVTFYAEYDFQRLRERVKEFENATGFSFDSADFDEPARRTTQVTVAYITDGGKGRQFLGPATMFLRLDALQTLLERPGQVNIIRITNPGDTFEGPETATAVFAAIGEALDATKRSHPDVASVQALTARNDKVFWLNEAEETGALFTTFLAVMASFSVMAGLLLIVNIFVMLAEERRGELGISRAVGMRRRHLVRAFTYEGALYGLPAAAVGAFAGLGLAAGLVWGFNRFFGADTFPPIPFRVEGESLIFAFSLGMILTIGTVVFAAYRTSGLNIVRAIRRIEEPEHLSTRVTLVIAPVIVAASLVATLQGFADGNLVLQIGGPTVAAIGLALFVRRFVSRRVAYPLVSLGLFAYLTTMVFVVADLEDDTGGFVVPSTAMLMALALGIAVLYAEGFTRLLSKVLGLIRGLRPIILPAMAYPLQKKFRSGMTLAMFSVILLMVSLFSILGNLFATDPSIQMGGYDVRGTTTQEVGSLDGFGQDPAALADVRFYETLPYFARLGGDLITVSGQRTGQFGPPQDAVWGIDDDFAVRNEFRLFFRHPDYATDEEAYRAVAARDDVVIVAYTYSTGEQGQDFVHDVGDTVQIHSSGGRVHEMTIVGVQEQFFFKGVFVKRALVDDLFTNSDTMFLFRLQDGVSAGDAALHLESNYRDIGLNGEDLRAEVEAFQQSFRSLLSMVQLFLGLGLIVGILSLGIVTARSVVERRQEIGMMRALGYQRRHIRRTFLIEMLMIVGLGVLIGGVVATIVSYGMFQTLLADTDVEYSLPWVELLTIAGIAFVATTLATLSPIFRAARTAPAEALRYIE